MFQSPQHNGKLLTLAAATATPIDMLVGQACYAITNNDSATVYWSFDSTVSATTGTPLAAGDVVTLTVTFQSARSGTQIYLFSTAGTAANAVSARGAT